MVIIPRNETQGRLVLSAAGPGLAALAARRLAAIMEEQLRCRLEICGPAERSAPPAVLGLCPPWPGGSAAQLKQAGIELLPDGRIRSLADQPYGDQGFVGCSRPPTADAGAECLLLAANTEAGLKNRNIRFAAI